MRSYFSLILAFLFVVFSYQLNAQCSNLTASAGTNAVLETEDIYLEEFSNQNDKGAAGGVLDISGCNWLIDVSAATLSDANDYFKVVNEKLEAKDVDGNCIWYSPSVNIADYSDVSISINASESGGLENVDIINSEYRVDGGPWSYFTTNGQKFNDFGSITISQSGLSGSIVEIRVTINVDQSNEQIRIDDIKVTGKRYKETICFGASTTLGGSPSASWSGAGTPAITYQWTPATGLSATNVSNPDANPTVNTTYKLVTILDDNGTICRDSSYYYLTVSPQIIIISDDPVCIDDTLRLSEAGGYATMWTWTSNGSANIIDFEDSTTQVVGMTNGEVFTVSVEDDDGCTNSDDITITVNPKPSNVTSNAYGTHCSSDAPFALSGGSPAGGYYDGPGVSDNNYDPSSAGYGSTLVAIDLMYIFTDGNGCKDTAVNPVNVQLAPEVELSSSFLSLPPTDANYLSVSPTGEWSKCGSTDPTFTLDLEITSASVVNNSANVTYDIDFGDGNSMLNISTGTVYSNTYLNQGPYDIVVTATDNISGCVRSYTKPFFFGTNPAISLGIPGNTQNQCAPRTYGFVATFSDNSGKLNSPGTMYTKYTNDGKPDSIFIHPNPATDLATGTIIHTFDDASCGYSTPFYDNSFLVGVAATNGCGSSSAEVSPITQSSPPIANMVDMDSIYCIEEPVTFSDSSLGGKYVYGANTGTGFSYQCDTVDAIAWVFEPDTGFTILSGSLGTIPLDYFDSTTYGTTELVVEFHYQMSYSVKLLKKSPCGSGMAADSSMHEFRIDSFPSAEFVLDSDIGCAPLVVENTNISRSLIDYNSTFSWGSSTLIPGCQGSSPPIILNTPSDSTLLELYIETFDLQTGKGISGVNTDTSNVDWTIDVSGNAMVNANDFFAVSNIFGDPRLVARDVNDGNTANMIWYSPSVDITGHSSVNLFLKARDSAAGNLEADDTFESFYRIDGGAWTYFENNGQLSANFGSVEVTQDSLSGSTLEIKVEMNVDDANEYLALDSILVRGYGEYDSLNSQYTFNKAGMYGIELTARNVCGPITYVDTVTVQGPPVLTLNPIDDTCNTKTAYATSVIDTCFGNMNLYSWRFPGGDIASSNQETPPAVNYNAVGTYWIYDSVANQCGSDYDSVSFTIHENPSISLLLTDSTCVFDSVQISPNVTNGTPDYNYLWEANGGITSTSILNPYASPLVDEYYVLTVTDDNSCEDIDSILIDVQSLPIVNAGLDQNICPEDTAFLSSSVAGGISPYNYYWDLGTLSDTTVLNPYYDMQGTSTFTLTAVDAFGCINSDQVIINEFVSPVVDAGDDTTICDLPISVDFDGSPAGGTWTGTNIDASGELLPNGIGQEEVIYQYTDFNGCYNEDTLLVDIVDPIFSNAGPNLEVCVSEGNIFLLGTPYGGIWDDPNTVSNSTSTLYEERFTGLNGKGATSSGTNVTGCNWSVDVSGASLTNGFKYLKVVSERLEARDLDGPAYWLSPSIPITNYVNVSISVAATELGSMEVDDVIETEYRIDGGAWTTFASNGSLGGNFTSAAVYQDGLSGNTLEIRVKMENNSSAEYLRIDDIIVTGDISGTYSFNTPGVVDLVYIYGIGNCANNDTTQVTIHNLPTVEAGADTALCISDSIIISGNPIGGTWSGTGISDASGKFLGSLAGDGDHTVYYSYVDANTCENLDSIIVTVYPLPQVDAGNDTILCNQPGVVDFDGNLVPGYWTGNNIDSSGGFEPTGVQLYEIYYHHTDILGCYNKDTLIINVIDPTNADAGADLQECVDAGTIQFVGSPIGGVWSDNGISISGDFTPTVQDTLDFVYSYGTGNCLTRDTVNLIVNPLPTVNVMADFSVCIDDTIQVLSANVSGGIWSGNGITDANGDFTPSVAGVGIHKINYLYIDSNACENSDSVFITVNGLPIVAAPNDTNICDLPALVNFDGSPLGGTWVGQHIDMNGLYTPNGSGVFELYYEYFDANSCYNIDTMILTVDVPQIADAGFDIQACEDTGLIQLVGLPLGVGTWVGTGVAVNGDYLVNSVDTVDLAYNIGSGNCFTTDTMNLLIHPLPVVDVDVDFEICISFGDTTLNFSPLGGFWEGQGITDTALGTFSPTTAGIGTHRLLYSYQHPITACWNYDSLDVTVNPLPVVSYDHDTIFCLNVGHQITNTTTGASFHYWSLSEGSLSNNQSPIFSLDTVGVFDINYVAETDRGCLDSLSSLVEVIAPPVAAYVAPDSGCGPWVVDFTNNSVGTYISYLWDLGFDNVAGGDSTTTDTVPSTQTYPAGIYFDTTYYTALTVSNVCGVDTDSLEITSMPQPVSLFGPSTNVGGCLSGTITFANNSYGLPDTYWWDFGDGNIGNNSDTIFDHYYTPGMSNQFYTVNMAVTNECGTDTSQTTVTILPSSLVAFFTVDTTFGCVPFTVDFQQLSVGGTTTSWDFDDGNFSNIYSPTHTFVNPGTYDVMLAVSNACNYDTLYKTITVNSSPQVSFSVVDDTLCAGSTFTFNNSSDLGISNYWEFGDGNDSYLTSPTHIYDSAGNFTVILTGTSLTNDCPAYDSVLLVVLPYPEVTGTPDINNGCIPLTVNFSNTVNSTGYFTWDFGDGNTSSQANPTHTYTTDGYYNVFVRFEDLSGCVDSFDFDVNPYPVPQAGFSIIQLDTCVLPANFDFSNSSLGATNYTWTFGDSSNQNLQTNPAHTYTNDGSYDVKLHVSNTYGCEDSIVNTLSINPVPNASFNALQLDTCVLPASFSFNNSSNGALAYTWDFGDGSTSNIPSLTYNYTSAGTYNVKLYSMNMFGCMDSTNTTVSVLPVPDVSFNFTKYDSCILPSNYGFTNTSSGASSYLWSFGQLGNSIQNNPAFTFTNDGIYEVKLIGLNSYGCSDSMISYINVLPIPNADFSLDQAVGCEPFSAVFLNTSQNTNYYNWDFGDGNTGSFFNGFHSYTNAGSYTIKLVVEDLNGCLDSTFSNVTVNPSPTADLTYVTSDPCYLPIDVFFTNASVGAIAFEWDFGNGQTSTITHPSTVYDTIGIYNLQLIASNSYNCTDTLNDPFSVFYNQVPNANFTFDDTICLRDTSLFNSTSLYADSIVWNLGNGLQSTGDSIAMVYDTPGQYTITMYAYNTGSGCSDTAAGNSTLVVLPSPIADFDYNQEFSSTQPRAGVVEFTNLSVGATVYWWDFENGDGTNNPNPTYNYAYSEDGTHTYILYAYNDEGCVDSASMEFVVNFRKALFVPNAMYVGHPDFEVSHFVPKGTGLETYHIEIFDTFGNVIWESDALDDEGKPTGAWDGTFKGITVEQDVYVWKVEATYKDETPWEGKYYWDEDVMRKTGTVTVIR